MADRLSKQDVINSVADATGLSKKDASGAVDAVVDTIKDALAAGNSVGLIGFGTFDVKTRAARTGRNPQTGAELNIPAKSVPSFKAGKELKDAVA
ncbi:MAG: HU family DNA-binding protein [Candidatus Poribacteria bacterium]|nr:HU family DNA-binding protein [Candidatus Poribacteria bacterium]MDE0506903.1 HU family DNA-binding protein [Candidatus Poribacteria bacterium]